LLNKIKPGSDFFYDLAFLKRRTGLLVALVKFLLLSLYIASVKASEIVLLGKSNGMVILILTVFDRLRE
jgi:hypothetical protein